MWYRIIFLFAVFGPILSWAQQDSVEILDTVYLSDQQLKRFNVGQKQTHISDSVIQSQSFALTDLLQQQTTIYFKQNGYGMVSSPAFRGTTASQTAVVWNGININSQLTGQTDFNTLLTANFSSVNIKSGGGSVLYGTGAIGGSIHLSQNLSSPVEEQHQFQTGYGSFNTFEARYSYQNQFDNLEFKLAYARRQSDNDYDIPSQNRQNENGQFQMNSLDAVMTFDLSETNQLKYFGNYTFGERNFSLIRASDPKTKYDNTGSRNMIEWQSTWDDFQSNLKAAYLTESFTFFDNLNRNTSSSSEVETQWLQYEFWYKLKKIRFNAVLNYQSSQAQGNQLANAQRDIAGVSFLFQHQINDKFEYEVTLRQDANDDFENPFLFSLGTEYGFNKKWSLRWHASKNYRLPTFNDLFWINGGNPELKAETAYQTELGSDFKFGNFKWSATGFFNDITDMIRWLPNANGIWRPRNTDEVQTYGIETGLDYRYLLSDKSYFDFKTQYAYTVSENQDTGNQLIYMPFHTANAQLMYTKSQWSANLFWLFNGSVFTRTDNDPAHQVSGYNLFDAQISWRIPGFFNSKLSLRAYNLFDLAYEAVDNRPMPGRSFTLNLNTKF